MRSENDPRKKKKYNFASFANGLCENNRYMTSRNVPGEKFQGNNMSSESDPSKKKYQYSSA